MDTMGLISNLREFPLFTIKDFSRFINGSKSYARNYLYRLSKKGLVKRIERGKYTVYDDLLAITTYCL